MAIEKQRLDKTLETRHLVSAREIIQTNHFESGEAGGRICGRVEQSQDIVLHPGDDLRPFDQFDVWVYAGNGASGSISLTVNLRTRTEGLATHDHFRSGVATKVDWTGWRKCIFPFENFLMIGCPEGWANVENVVIHIGVGNQMGLSGTADQTGGIIGIGDVDMERRERVVGPRLTDEGFFDEMNLDHPGLEAVKVAVETHDLERAKTELLAYFRNRSEPWHPFDPEVGIDPGYPRAHADRICDHFIQNQQLPEDFYWRINPIGYLEWMHALNRHFFLMTLYEAYKRTGDEKYAVKLDYFLDTWMRQNPEPVGHNGGGDPAWETLSTSCRPRRSWMYVWYGLEDSPSFRPQTRIDMLKSLWAHAEHLTRYEGYRNNWFIVESEAIALIGVLFPEFKQAEVWKNRGYERLSEAIAEQVYPDGAQYEISAGYHSMSGGGFELPYELARHNGLPIDPLLVERLEKMYEYTAWTARPDFSHPSINDSGGVSGGRVEWAAKGGKLFNRKDLRWVGTSGKEGTVPNRASRAFKDAGIYVMRSDWGPDARYLILDAGPYSAAHQHEDKLSFEFCYGSDPLIVDPGIESYMRDPWTDYYKHTRAHNTVLIDGGGQKRRQAHTWPEWVRSVRGENAVQMGNGLDYVISRYDAGYENVPDGDRIAHERAVIFVRNDYYLVLDRVTGGGTHTVEALFHFMPVRVQVDRGRVRTDREGRKNVELVPLAFGPRLTPRLITGQNNPVQGWVANRENMPAPCVVYRRTNVVLPLVFGWVLAPFATGRSADLRIRRIHTAGGHAFRLVWPGRRSDLVFWRWGGAGEVDFGGYTTDAKGAIIRRQGRKVAYAGAIEGTVLEGRGIALAGQGLVE